MRMLPFVLLLSACHVALEQPLTGSPCAAIAQAECNKRNECSNGTSITRTFGDMATCLEREQLSCENSLAAPDTGNTAASLEGCVAAYATY